MLDQTKQVKIDMVKRKLKIKQPTESEQMIGTMILVFGVFCIVYIITHFNELAIMIMKLRGG